MNIIVNGAAGRMGQQVCRLLAEQGHTLAAAVDRSGWEGFYAALADYTGPADVVVDFSFHEGVGELVDYCVGRKLPLVAATTGYTPEEFRRLEEGAKEIPIFQSYNMSIGVALLAKLVKQAAAIFQGCDVEIVEAHHNRKADAPSGTAKLLLEAIDPQHRLRPVYGREGNVGKRERDEVGIHALRGGTVAGTHTVHFFGPDEELELTHRAASRRIVVNGALHMARLLPGRPNGVYDLQKILFGECL